MDMSSFHHGIRRTIKHFIYSFFSVPSFISRDIEQAMEWYHWKGNEMKFTEKIENIEKMKNLFINF